MNCHLLHLIWLGIVPYIDHVFPFHQLFEADYTFTALGNVGCCQVNPLSSGDIAFNDPVKLSLLIPFLFCLFALILGL